MTPKIKPTSISKRRALIFSRRRELLGWTVRDASKKAGLANGTITAAEDPSSDPKESTLVKLANGYAIDPSALLNPSLSPYEVSSGGLNSAG